MLNLKQDVIRQLNAIYKISFKLKYKEEIKERIILFIDKTYGALTLLEIKNIKEEILLVDNEIKILTIEFFNKYKTELLNSFNPIWYEEKEKHIPIYAEKEYFKAFILKDCIEKVDQHIRLKYRKNLIHLSNNGYGYPIRQQFKNFVEKRIGKKYIFNEREIELKQLKKEIEENVSLYLGNAKVEKRQEIELKRYGKTTVEQYNNDLSEIAEQLKKIEDQDENYFINFHSEKLIPNQIDEYTNSSFDYLYGILLLKEINKKLNKN